MTAVYGLPRASRYLLWCLALAIDPAPIKEFCDLGVVEIGDGSQDAAASLYVGKRAEPGSSSERALADG